MSWRELLSRTTIANVVAAICVTVFCLYGIVTGKIELIKDAILIMIGYLFGRSVVTATSR